MEKNINIIGEYQKRRKEAECLEIIETEGGIEKLLEYKHLFLAYREKFEKLFKSKNVITYTKLINNKGDIISTDIKSNSSLKESKLYIKEELQFRVKELEEEIKSLKSDLEFHKENYSKIFDTNYNLNSELKESSIEKEHLVNKIKDLDEGFKSLNDSYNKLITENLNITEQNKILKNNIKVDLISRIKFLFNKNYYN